MLKLTLHIPGSILCPKQMMCGNPADIKRSHMFIAKNRAEGYHPVQTMDNKYDHLHLTDTYKSLVEFLVQNIPVDLFCDKFRYSSQTYDFGKK